MRLRRRSERVAERRILWQAASLLLAYPDEDSLPGIRSARSAAADLPVPTGAPLVALADAVLEVPLLEAQQHYVATFDWKRRRALFLTFWTAGDTRNRGTAMLRFVDAYRAAGVRPPQGELADHLAVVLEFAATVDPDAGQRLLAEHGTPLRLLRDALVEAGSPYAAAVAAVCATLPEPGRDDLASARRLAAAGPPVEAVGLQPFPIPLPTPTVGAPA